MRRPFTVGLLTAGLCLGAAASPALAQGGGHNVTKATFTGVLLGSNENAIVEASSKQTNKAGYTVCEYYTAGWTDYLGQFEVATATAPADLGQFCVDHFADRSVG